MKNIHQQIESETLNRIRNRYEAEGYRFVIRPGKPDVPRFLEGFEPDALALKGNGGVIIEVKASGKAATRSPVVEFLAREVPKHKGWKFELVLADKEGVEPSPSLQPSRSEIVSRLAEVESLVKDSNRQVALLYAWALLEAATRLTILRDQEDKRFLPRTVVEAIASNGFLSQDEEHKLAEIGKLRTWIVHGFTRVAVDQAQVRLLLEIVRRLVGHEEKSITRARRTRR
jgi:uncharacterized protein YutE (UPF0331/DUF86 family)